MSRGPKHWAVVAGSSSDWLVMSHEQPPGCCRCAAGRGDAGSALRSRPPTHATSLICLRACTTFRHFHASQGGRAAMTLIGDTKFESAGVIDAVRDGFGAQWASTTAVPGLADPTSSLQDRERGSRQGSVSYTH